jgi:hypothetical protein
MAASSLLIVAEQDQVIKVSEPCPSGDAQAPRKLDSTLREVLVRGGAPS